jgi:transcriptional regulator with XRE-family HTH domain
MSTPIDTAWFTDRLAERRLSQRGLAKLMGIDPAAISLMFRGKRRMALEEAAQLAVLLDVSTTEVLERAGLPVHGEARVPLIGYTTATFEVVQAGEGAHDMVEAPPGVPSDCVAIQGRTANTDRDQVDGWLYFVAGNRANPASCVGDMAWIAVKNNGQKLCWLKKGYRRGTYNLVGHKGVLLENAELAWASPVLWIKTKF